MGAIKRGLQRVVDAAWYATHGGRHARQQRAFAAARQNRLTAGWISATKPSDADIRYGLKVLRARSREQSQNNDYVKQFLRLLKTNVVGAQGIALQARTQDPNGTSDVLANQAIEEALKQWSKRGSADVTGQLSWKMIQRMFIENAAIDGEVLVRRVIGWRRNKYRFALQFLDPELLDVEYNQKLGNGRYIRMGIEYDDWRRPVAFHLLQTEQNATDYYSLRGKKYKRIPAEEIYHCFLPEWALQSRGVPWVTTPLMRLGMLDGYEEAELVAARTASAKMGFFVDSEAGEGYMGDGREYPGANGEGDYVTEAEPGTFERLPHGVQFQSFDPNHPTTAYADFVKSCLRGISAGLGVTYTSLSNDLEGVNYSSLRHSAIAERDVWMTLQDWMIECFMEPVYRDWLEASLLAGAITVVGKPLAVDRMEKYQRVGWQPRRWPWVDPQKEMTANEKAYNLRVRSLSSIIREEGRDPDEVWEEIARERQRLDELNVPAPEPANSAGSVVTGDGTDAQAQNNEG